MDSQESLSERLPGWLYGLFVAVAWQLGPICLTISIVVLTSPAGWLGVLVAVCFGLIAAIVVPVFAGLVHRSWGIALMGWFLAGIFSLSAACLLVMLAHSGYFDT